MKDISIIIVNYNTLDMVSACIDSVLASTAGLDCEIILVDNGSTDGSREKFSADGRLKYIYSEENLGFGRANNIGLKEAEGRNIFFLNSDTLVVSDAVKILSSYLDTNPSVGACGGNLTDIDGRPGQSYSLYRPGIRAELERFLEIKPESYNYSTRPKQVGSISGADLMVRKTVLDKVGGFDDRFFLYFEETELCARIEAAGWKIMSVPSAQIIHFGGATVRAEDKEALYYASRKLYLELTHTPFRAAVANAIWKATVHSRIILNAFNPERQTKWKNRKGML